MLKITIFIILGIVITLIQVSFLSNFDFFVYYLNLILIILILLTMLKGYKPGIIFAVVSGLILDIYSPFYFGLITISLVTPVIVIHNLFQNFLARKSIYSLSILAIISNTCYFFILLLLSKIIYWVGLNSYNIGIDLFVFKNIVYTIFWNTVVTLLLFLILRFIVKRIKSKFIIIEQF